jgi:hypothetical protein
MEKNKNDEKIYKVRNITGSRLPRYGSLRSRSHTRTDRNA